jgi:DNA-binding transcriptional ArsR family regulator
MNTSGLARAVQALERRVAELEGARAPRRDAALVEDLLGRLADGQGQPRAATVVYAGAGPWEDGAVAWQMGRSWDDVVAAADEGVARVLSALANETRVRIVVELLRGPVSTGDLAVRLDQPSTGQLFHHLKDLLAAGVIHQPVRGSYAVRRQHAVPLLAVLSAAADLGSPVDRMLDPS